MDIEIARSYLRLSQDEDSWDVDDWAWIRREFLSVDWGENAKGIVAAWNKLVPPELAATVCRELTEREPGFTDRLACGDASVTVPYTRSPEDCMRVVIALNTLMGDRAQLRLSHRSTGNSDWCYLPQNPADWAALEDEFGRDHVEARFQTLPSSWEALDAALG